ncbi:hypothetical protein BN3590_02750 [Clostridium sp. C105KSO15]|nr:hypothetical protein BN3590_02750 [Clostridium sp. C105KSO15]
MENKNQVLMFDRIPDNYATLIDGWSSMESSKLFKKTEEIYVAYMVQN